LQMCARNERRDEWIGEVTLPDGRKPRERSIIVSGSDGLVVVDVSRCRRSKRVTKERRVRRLHICVGDGDGGY
jgi:hypothetical protein